MKLRSRLLVIFCQKKGKFGYLNTILGKLGVTDDLGWWLIEKPMVNFLFALTELFSYLLRFQIYEVKCVQLGCFRRGATSLHSNFTWTGLFPINHSWHQKTRVSGLPNGKDRILCISSLWQYRSVMNRWTDGFAVAYTVLAKLASRHAVKIKINVWLISITTLCLKKVPTFNKLRVTLSNLNRSSKTFVLLEGVRNLLQNLYNTTHLTLGMLLHYHGKLKIRIFCRYSADMEENANKFHCYRL